jgi:two-component system phosphate regulon sensor histidine kinase PhoR
MTLGLALGVTGTVALAFAVGAYFYSHRHYQTLLDTARATALAQGHLILAALEHQMIENDRTLIERMVKTFGREPHVRRVMLLDREGRPRFSSAASEPDTALSIDSPTCQACHRLPPDQRASSQVIDSGEEELLRTVIPVRNREACYGCHDPARRINGVLIVDLDAGEIRATMNRDLRWMAGGSIGLAAILVAAIAMVVRLAVMRRLQRFETTARLIASGDLERRVPVEGSDTLAWLAEEFNTMADSVTGLVSDVRHEREQLERVINGIDDGIVVLDRERKIVAANDAFLTRVGAEREQVLGSSCREATVMCGSGDCPTLACITEGRRQIRICERRGPGEESVWEEVHASPIRRSNGEIVHVVEVWRDITDRRSAEARLAESHRLASLGLLASGFSHELNTPLGTTLTCVEGIQRAAAAGGEDDPEGRRRIEENAAIAREQLLRCRGITQHFLRLSRGQHSSGELLELGPVFAAVTRLIEPTARDHGVTIAAAPVPNGVHVRASEADLEHVLLNLLLNAVQACPRGGNVALSVHSADDVRIRVSDDGCGIPPDRLRLIFEPFVSGRPGGTGLGLFLSLDFVRKWGGDISVSSKRGSGTTFEVVLPAAEHPPAGPGPMRVRP